MKELAMCPPLYLDSTIPNNAWMKDIPEEERTINVDLAMKQFHDLYSLMSEEALIYLIPPIKGFQDMTYATNHAVILPHLDKVAILSNFRAEGRQGEEVYAAQLLSNLGYKCYKCPYYFEGEGELKWLHDNVYIGGYGIRAEEKALDWISDNFDCKIIKVKEPDDYLYHVDCLVFPISLDYAIVYEGIGEEAINKIKRETNIILIDRDLAMAGITNSCRIELTVFNANNISACKPNTKEYEMEKRKNDKLVEICNQLGLFPCFVELTEFLKSGALLSCLILHLKYDNLTLGV